MLLHGKDVEKGECFVGNVNEYSHGWKRSRDFINIRSRVVIWSCSPTIGFIPKKLEDNESNRYLHHHGYSSTVQCWPNLESTKLTTIRQVKQTKYIWPMGYFLATKMMDFYNVQQNGCRWRTSCWVKSAKSRKTNVACAPLYVWATI